MQRDPGWRQGPPPWRGSGYLLLADISGYTGFMAGVEQEHGVDFSAGIPAAYGVLGALLDAVVEGVERRPRVTDRLHAYIRCPCPEVDDPAR